MLSSNRNLQVSELPLTFCLKARALPIVIVFDVLDGRYFLKWPVIIFLGSSVFFVQVDLDKLFGMCWS